MKYISIILLLLFTGCYTTYDIVEDKLPLKQIGYEEHQTVDTILKYYFTKKAYEVIKDIPMIDGVAKMPYVVGVNGWSIFASILVGNGYSRKVVMTDSSLKFWGVSTIIHEYIHHLDDMDRDGEAEWIDHDEFVKAYKRLGRDMRYAGIVHYVERKANHWFTNWFGIGEYAEYIAYTGGYIFQHNAPNYIKHVFRKILRFK